MHGRNGTFYTHVTLPSERNKAEFIKFVAPTNGRKCGPTGALNCRHLRKTEHITLFNKKLSEKGRAKAFLTL